ncbi:DUF397 domain-containing protein [Actinomadura sp. PM05-2]|uniref:DUF397 domain-containing protein n=1 Tax=Actinomadura parmotrematis TaxID=2864039 RepID=A0ABS7FV97_9ACTN|nr:DUF397 domain-containing protein [Actinomadura parmotrematis]
MELAGLGRIVALRDSKAPDAGHLTLTRATLATLLTTLKAN